VGGVFGVTGRGERCGEKQDEEEGFHCVIWTLERVAHPVARSKMGALIFVVCFQGSRNVGKSDTEWSRSVWGLYPDFVIDGTLNPLFAAEISFGCLNRNVTEEKLNLFEFASSRMAKPSTGSAEVVRR